MTVEGLPADLEYYLNPDHAVDPIARALAKEVIRLRERINAGLDELYRANAKERELLDSFNTLLHRKGADHEQRRS